MVAFELWKNERGLLSHRLLSPVWVNQERRRGGRAKNRGKDELFYRRGRKHSGERRGRESLEAKGTSLLKVSYSGWKLGFKTTEKGEIGKNGQDDAVLWLWPPDERSQEFHACGE